jgi:hypothetical protein
LDQVKKAPHVKSEQLTESLAMVAPQQLVLPDPRASRGAPYTNHHICSRTTPFNEILFQRPYLEATLYYWQNRTMASFEPSLSTSGMRPPLASAEAPSMADSLPSINFGFEDLRSRMAQFTAKFDAFIERGRKQVLEERNQFRINLAELQGRFLIVRLEDAH